MNSGVPPATLDTLLRAVRSGERECYGEVVTLLEAPVRVLLSLLVPDRAVVEDLAHEVFVLAYLKLGEYQDGTDFRAWLKAIARNLAHNERRRWVREQRLKRRYAAALEDDVVGPALDLAIATTDQAQLAAALRECVAELGGAPQDTVQRYYFDGASVAQIAAATGRAAGAVKVMLFRARAALGKCLASKGLLLPPVG